MAKISIYKSSDKQYFLGGPGGLITIENIDKKQPRSQRATTKLIRQQLLRAKQDVRKWRNALQAAESELRPDRVELLRIYQDVVLDGHLSSLMSTIDLRVRASDFNLHNDDGTVNEDETKKIKKRWFKEFVKWAIESQFYGHSLVQFGDIVDDTFVNEQVVLIDREFVVPEKQIVKFQLHIQETGIPYTEPPFSNWVIEVGTKRGLGLLNKATPLVLWKKNVFPSWSEYAEIFGMPTRLGKTDINDPVAKKNMDEMLSKMGSAAYGVFDNDDDLQFVETKRTDAHEIYDKLIERTNSELSKLFLGQTMTSDDGSSLSQSKTHMEILDDYISATKDDVTDVVNDDLLPLMRFHGMIPDGLTFRYDESEQLNKVELFKLVEGLIKLGFEISSEWISETFSIPVEEAEEAMPNPDDEEAEEEAKRTSEEEIKNIANAQKVTSAMMRKVNQLVKGFGKKHKH